jgi:hypothetical protein
MDAFSAVLVDQIDLGHDRDDYYHYDQNWASYLCVLNPSGHQLEGIPVHPMQSGDLSDHLDSLSCCPKKISEIKEIKLQSAYFENSLLTMTTVPKFNKTLAKVQMKTSQYCHKHTLDGSCSHELL